MPLDRLCAHQLCRYGFFCSRNCGCPVAPIAFVPEIKRFGILVSRLDGSDLMGAAVPKRFGRTGQEMWDMKFTKLGGTRVSLLGEKPLRRRTNARSARLPHAGSPTNNQKRRKPFRRADSSEGYRGLPRRAFGIWLTCSHARQRSSRRVANFFFASFFLFGKEKS